MKNSKVREIFDQKTAEKFARILENNPIYGVDEIAHAVWKDNDCSFYLSELNKYAMKGDKFCLFVLSKITFHHIDKVKGRLMLLRLVKSRYFPALMDFYFNNYGFGPLKVLFICFIEPFYLFWVFLLILVFSSIYFIF